MNAVFVIGAICVGSCVRTQDFELAAMTAEAWAGLTRHVLTELESGEPDAIEVLKKRLEQSIEQAEEIADMWLNAATGKKPGFDSQTGERLGK